jgi:phage shock protein PspC (stress-responsive transcriptional regulator)
MNESQIFIRRNGVFGGVCGGLAYKLDVPVFIIRLALLASLFFTAGITLLLYIVAVFAFPNEFTIAFGDRPMVLGVCHNLAPKMGIHESWLRFFALLLWVFTGFVPVFVIYMIVYLINSPTQKVETRSSGVRDVN